MRALACLGAILFLVPGGNSTARDQGRDHHAGADYNFYGWSIRPNGEGFAYVGSRYLFLPKRLGNAGNTITLWYGDTDSGKRTLVRQFSLRGTAEDPTIGAYPINPTDAQEFHPTWSPDGSRLAYYFPESGGWRLHVWNVLTHGDRPYRPAVNPVSFPQWSPDGRKVYVTSFNEAAPQSAERLPSLPFFVRRAPGSGMRVLVSDANVTQKARYVQPATQATVEEVDTASGHVVSIFSSPSIRTVKISPDGNEFLVLVDVDSEGTVRQVYTDGILLSKSTKEVGASVFWTAQRILTHTTLMLADWSPDSARIALLSMGARGTGDIHIYTLANQQLTDISQAEIAPEVGEIIHRPELSSRTYTDDGTKFFTFSWASASTFFALRHTRLGGTSRTRLWEIGLDGHTKNLTSGADFDLVAPPQAVGVGALALVQHANGNVSFQRIDLGTGALETVVSMVGRIEQPDLRRAVALSRDGKIALFVRESATAPQEMYKLEVGNNSVTRMTFVNADLQLTFALSVRRVDYQTSHGARFGYLYVPGHPQHVPLVVTLYPRDASEMPTLNPSTFVGGVHLGGLFLELLKRGYAVFRPDIPVVGGGGTCDDVADNLTAAISELRSISDIDTGRVAIYGHSFGGWAVGCAVTHTQLFRAAVDMAGISDLESISFSILQTSSAWGIGGGQTMIGKSVWEAPDLFWRESPVSRLQSITTPLLLIHGSDDRVVPLSQSEEMYSGLFRLGKTVSFVTYYADDHDSILWEPDLEGRFFAWLTKYIGNPEPIR